MKTSHILFALLATVATGSAIAASTANLLLRGTVGTVNEISITPNGTNNIALDIINGEVDRYVADATEISNSQTGYSIQMSSANNGYLLNTGNSALGTFYYINYDNAGYSPLSTSPTVVKVVSPLTTTMLDVSPILVYVNPYATASSGDYEDTVTFSIVAN